MSIESGTRRGRNGRSGGGLPVGGWPAHRLKKFARDEQGSFVVFTLFLLIAVFIVAGIAVDVVRFEAQRTRLQNTLDRAILAAADMSQQMTAQEVVDSYFEKAGLTEYLGTVSSSSGFTVKTVTATGSGDMDTFFMKMLGIDELTPTAAGTAEESISDIEVSLVLDISGSMTEYIYETVTVRTRYGSRTYQQNTGETKIEALKDAAAEFIDTIFASTTEGRTSMSIVPYATQVNVGPDLLAHYNVSTEHTYNNCVHFGSDDFSTTAISTSDTLTRADHLDVWYRTAPPTLNICDTNNANAILAFGDDAVELQTHVEGLTARGNTSIDIGMKWGSALLDPSTQGVVTAMIADDDAPESFEGRPFAFSSTDTMKVIVVMTDGINTSQYYLDPDYTSQNSGVWKWVDGTTTKYSVYFPEGSSTTRDGDSNYNESYWRVSECYREACSSSSYAALNPAKYGNTPAGGDAAVQLTFRQLWAEMSIDYHAYYLRYAVRWDEDDYYDWNNEPYDYVGATDKNTRLDTICTEAKDNGIIVFAIGFEVTDASAAIMEDCASSTSHFYRVEGLEITTAFQSIANAIGKLRLTQ